MTKVIESNIDPYAWKTELERVAPRLRTKVRKKSTELQVE